jgi:hypothetical protein
VKNIKRKCIRFFSSKKKKKKWNSVLIELHGLCKFEPNRPIIVVAGLNGLRPEHSDLVARHLVRQMFQSCNICPQSGQTCRPPPKPLSSTQKISKSFDVTVRSLVIMASPKYLTVGPVSFVPQVLSLMHVMTRKVMATATVRAPVTFRRKRFYKMFFLCVNFGQGRKKI